MPTVTGRPAGWLAGTSAVAALLVGAVFAGTGAAELRYAGYLGLGPGVVRTGGLMVVVMAVAVTGACLVGWRAAWPLAAVGLTLVAAGGWVSGAAGRPSHSDPMTSAQLLAVALPAAGVGLALAGALAAAGRPSTPSYRLATAVGLAGGVAAGRWLIGLPFWLGGWPGMWPSPERVTVWLGMAAAVAAALAVAAAGVRAPAPPERGPVVAVLSGAVIVVLGLIVRTAVINAFRLSPDGLSGPRRERAVTAFAHYSAVAVALAVALPLTVYAYRRAGARAARWVVLCTALAGIVLTDARVSVRDGGSVVPLLVACAAVAAGAVLARVGDRWFPWDSLGLAIAAVGLPLDAYAVRAEWPALAWAQPALVLGGLGLGLSAGITGLVAPRRAVPRAEPIEPAAGPAAVPADRSARLTGTLVMGGAGLVLVAHSLSALTVDVATNHPAMGPPLTMPVLAVGGAALIGVLFGFDRMVERIRRDLAAAAREPD